MWTKCGDINYLSLHNIVTWEIIRNIKTGKEPTSIKYPLPLLCFFLSHKHQQHSNQSIVFNALASPSFRVYVKSLFLSEVVQKVVSQIPIYTENDTTVCCVQCAPCFSLSLSLSISSFYILLLHLAITE